MYHQDIPPKPHWTHLMFIEAYKNVCIFLIVLYDYWLGMGHFIAKYDYNFIIS